VLPVARGFPQPLVAAYRTRLAPRVAALVADGRLRPAYLFQDALVLRLDEDALLSDPALLAADPDLQSVLNVNAPADYAAARARPAPEVTVESLAGPSSRVGSPRRQVRAATVGAAAAAVSLPLGRHVLTTVNGERTGCDPDPDYPLVAGDAVAFTTTRMSA
jgi:molybdenum cofactor guanylyltransferase